jgi:hypothetical protein
MVCFKPKVYFFGGGIKGNLKEIYMAAKQNQRIIETLDPDLYAQQQEKARRKPTRDWRPEVDELVEMANKLKGGKIPGFQPAQSQHTFDPGRGPQSR